MVKQQEKARDTDPQAGIEGHGSGDPDVPSADAFDQQECQRHTPTQDWKIPDEGKLRHIRFVLHDRDHHGSYDECCCPERESCVGGVVPSKLQQRSHADTE